MTMDDFFRRLGPALRRAFDPVDVQAPRRLWGIRMFALAAAIYSFSFSPFGESRPTNLILFFGAMTLLVLTAELKKLWDRVEHLEAEARLRQVRTEQPFESANSN